MNQRICWPVLFHSLALIIAFDVRYLNSHLSYVWVFFHIIGCGLMLFDGTLPAKPRPFVLAWAIAILFCMWVSATGAASQGLAWALLGMPTLALSMKEKYLETYVKAFGGIVGLYALMLIVELAAGFQAPNPVMQYRFFALTGAWGFLKASAWPMIDPNNAALVINCALVPCFVKAQADKKWWFVALFFMAALICTSSKAGICTALAVCGGIALFKVDEEDRWWMCSILACIAVGVGATLARLPMNSLSEAFTQRLNIWQGALKIVNVEGFWGVGMGMFGEYYRHFTIEHVSSQSWAHNDTMQIGLEMGLVPMLLFIGMFVDMWRTTTRYNLASAGVLTAVLMQSMVEFQFYVPVVSLLAGLAFAHHRLRGTKV